MQTIEVAPKTKWSIDHAHCEIGFSVRHLMIAHVKGVFKTFDASIYTIDKDFRTTEVDFWINASSLTTGDANRDKHLKSREFFNAKKYKQITFKSTEIINPDQDGNHELWGDLTMMDVTRNIKLNIKQFGMLNDPWGKERAGFKVTGEINRKDWSLILNSPSDSEELMISDEVSISCEIELTKMGRRCRKMDLEPAFEEEYFV